MCQIGVHKEMPDGFNPQVEVAACYLEVKEKLLLLQTGLGKDHAGMWGLPAGKLEKGESALESASRELLKKQEFFWKLSLFFLLELCISANRRSILFFICSKRA